MTLLLPPRPNLDQLKKQAKELLKAHRARDPSACPMLRSLHRFQGRDDKYLLAAEISLHEAQLALAMEYGFENWAGLKAHVVPAERKLPSIQRDSGRVWIENVLEAPVGSGRNRQLLGLRSLLHSRGIGAELDELLAYGGNAFASSHPERWHEATRLAVPTDFMLNAATAFGCELRWHFTPFCKSMEEYESLTQAALSEIKGHVDEGYPVLVGGVTERGCNTWSIVVGYDTSKPQLGHVGLGRGIRWMGIRGVAFPCNAEEGLDKHWNAQVQVPRHGAYTLWLVNPFVTLDASHAVDRRRRIVRTLRLAVDLFHHVPKPPDRVDTANYWFGQDAFEHAACDYETVTLGQVLDTSPREAACRLQMLCDQVAWLRDGRRAAAAFCRQGAAEGVLEPAMLAEAADQYERVAQSVDQELHDLPQASFEEAQHWYEVEFHRSGAARVLREAASYERKAVLNIEKALAAQKEG